MKARTYKAVFSFDVAKQCQPDGSCLVERICITESLDIPLSRVFERISNFQRSYHYTAMSGINVNFVLDDEAKDEI